MAKDKIAQKKRYDTLSPNSKKLKNQKRAENRRKKAANTKIIPKMNPDLKDEISQIVKPEPKADDEVSINTPWVVTMTVTFCMW